MTTKTTREETMENIVESIMKDKRIDYELNKYRFKSDEIIYAVYKSFTAGYGMNFNCAVYRIDSYTEKLPKEMRKIVEKYIIKYTNLVSDNTMTNAINLKNQSVATRAGIKNLVENAYDLGADYRAAYDKAMSEIEESIKI